MLIKYLNLLFICIAIWFPFDGFCSSSMTDFQAINREIINRQQRGSKEEFDFSKKLQPILDEAIGCFFQKDKVTSSTIPLSLFLVPLIEVDDNKAKNPYLTYAVWRLIQSNDFKTASQEQRQQVCFLLMEMLFSENNIEAYTPFFNWLYSYLLMNFNDSENDYNDSSRDLLQQFIHKNSQDIHSPKLYKALLLLLIVDYDSQTLLQKNRPLLKIFSEQYSRKNFRMKVPLISLIMLTHCGDDSSMEKLNNVVQEIQTSPQKIEEASFIFPYLSLIRTPQMVALLKDYLEDDNILDQGEDILNRFTGIAPLAASSLYAMLEKFPSFSLLNFGQSERNNCIAWLSKNRDLKFKKIDYWKNDSIISRLRYLIFDKP